MNLLLSVDQLGNSILGGDPDETISSRIGRIKRKHSGRIPLTRPVSRLTDWVLDIIDPNHSMDAIEENRGRAGVFDRPENGNGHPKPPSLKT
jgi:hypothetical protein